MKLMGRPRGEEWLDFTPEFDNYLKKNEFFNKNIRFTHPDSFLEGADLFAFSLRLKAAFARYLLFTDNDRELASVLLGRSWGQIRRYLRADTVKQPPLEFITKLAEGSQLPLSWILTGEEHLSRDLVPSSRPRDLTEYQLQAFANVDKNITGNEKLKHPELFPVGVPNREAKNVEIDMYDLVNSDQTGSGRLILRTGKAAMPKDALFVSGIEESDAALVFYMGYAMAPVINDGDMFLIDTSEKGRKIADDNGIYVVKAFDAAYLRRLSIVGNAVRLTPENDDDGFILEVRDPSKIEIIGRVVWLGKRF